MNPKQQQFNGFAKTEAAVPCPKCGAPLKLTFEDPIYTHAPTASIIVIEHNKPHCLMCNVNWAPVILVGGVGVTSLAAVPPKNGLYVPPGVQAAHGPGQHHCALPA